MILIVGAGTIGLQYADILTAMSVPFTLLCRSEQTANKVLQSTPHRALVSDASAYLAHTTQHYSHAIVATAIKDLATVTQALIAAGIEQILVEKPLTFSSQEAAKLAHAADAAAVKVWIAYNRRFIPSVQRLRDLLAQDGRIQACRFEFSEWIDKISWSQKEEQLIENWLIANSSHVIDLAFFLIGYPKAMTCIADTPVVRSDKTLPASRFAGCGLSENDIIFSYLSCWDAPGRWRLEVMTANHRYLLEPLEQLSVTARNSLSLEKVDVTDKANYGFKPGFYQQVQAFLQQSPDLMSIRQLEMQLLNCRKIASGCQEFYRAAVNE
ncbi:MAG: Gfo/Idh/MocA family oxidoreductase [Alishewanella aestuarii]